MNFLWWSKYACIYIKFTLKQLCTMALKVVSMFLERGEMHISLPLFLPYLHNKELTDIRYTAITQ